MLGNEEHEPDDVFGLTYAPVILAQIKVKTELDSIPDDPKYVNRFNLYDAIEDIKKALADGIDSANYVHYYGFEIIPDSKGSINLPSSAIMNFRIKYTQDRNDPSQVGCAP